MFEKKTIFTFSFPVSAVTLNFDSLILELHHNSSFRVHVKLSYRIVGLYRINVSKNYHVLIILGELQVCDRQADRQIGLSQNEAGYTIQQ